MSMRKILPEWILLLPVGQVELLDRPEPLQVDPDSLAKMVTAFRSRGVDLVIDYEHQSLQGRQAPAAGWIKDLEDRGDGLWARVEWTAQAREYLRNREYRYFSPVLQLDPETRKPLALMQVGLTNVPAIKRLPPLRSYIDEYLIREKVGLLHGYKNELNFLIKQLTQEYDLEISVEVLEVKADGQLPKITGIELSVKQEICP